MQNVHFTPPQLAKFFGVNVSTIKRWVDRGILRSEKTAGGHRRISEKDLAKFIKQYKQYAPKSYTLNRLTKEKNKTKKLDWKKYYDYLYKEKDKPAEEYLNRLLLLNKPLHRILDEVVSRSLMEIGMSWSRGELSIFEEHRMSFLIRQHLLIMEGWVLSKKKRKRIAVLACAPGEHHELPLQMLSLVLINKGYQPVVLGINISVAELTKAINHHKAGILCITKQYSKLKGKSYLESICKKYNKTKLDIFFGGGGWSQELRERKWKNKNIHFIKDLEEFDKNL